MTIENTTDGITHGLAGVLAVRSPWECRALFLGVPPTQFDTEKVFMSEMSNVVPPNKERQWGCTLPV